jgi:hypothetical protein
VKRLPLIIRFDNESGPSWDEFRRVWTGRTVTLHTDTGDEWKGTLAGAPTVNDGVEVFHLTGLVWPLEHAGLDVAVGCDTVTKALA